MHNPQAEEGHDVPFVSTDYFFLGVDEERAQPMLVIKDHRSKHVRATSVDAKGPTKFATNFCKEFLNCLGHRKLLLKSDNEPAILALKTSVKKATEEVDIAFQEVAVGDHAANGMIESEVREIAKECRVIKSCLETRLGVKLDYKHPLLLWIPAYASAIRARCWMLEDGKTPYHRNYGKEYKRKLPAYGEQVLRSTASVRTKTQPLVRSC